MFPANCLVKSTSYGGPKMPGFELKVYEKGSKMIKIDEKQRNSSTYVYK